MSDSEEVETRPTEKELLDHVVPKVASRWQELGLKLLTGDQVAILRVNNPCDARQCCMAMFMEWLQTNTDASWRQLIEELQSSGVNLFSVAKDLEKKFLGNIKEADKTIREAVMTQPSSENLLCATVKDEMLHQLIQEYSKLISNLIDLFQETPIESLVRYFNIGNDESVRRDQIQGTEAKDFFNYLTEQQKLNYYAPDLLSNFVAASYHEEAKKKIDHYINSSYHTLLKNFNLICESERITKEKVQIFGNKKLLHIKSEAVPLSSQKETFIRNAMCKCLKLPPYSVLFTNPMPGCITLVYKMSDNVKQQVLKNVFLDKELLPLANQNITWLRIDNKMELKIPSVKESMEDTVVSWSNIKTKELDKVSISQPEQLVDYNLSQHERISYQTEDTNDEKVRDYTTIKQEKNTVKVYETNKTPKKSYGFYWPYLLVKGPNGELLVGNNHKDAKHLVVFDEKLQKSQVIDDKDRKFGVIHGIAVDSKKNVYVSDGKLNCIWIFMLEDGKFISQFGKRGHNQGQFNEPAGLLFSKKDLLFVCDRHNHRIQVFQDGGYFYEFGEFSYDLEPGALREPVDLALNSTQQMLFVTCWRNNTVQVFTPNGKILREIKAFPVVPFFFEHPNGIFCTSDDYLLVASKHHVVILTIDGSFISAIEGEYKGNERFSDCIGVVMMNDGKIVVSDGCYGTDRLIIF